MHVALSDFKFIFWYVADIEKSIYKIQQIRDVLE